MSAPPQPPPSPPSPPSTPPTPPTLSTKESSAKLKRELVIFFFVLALVLCAAGYWLFVGDAARERPIWGLARNVALGAPTLAIALAYGVAGVLIMLGASRPGVIAGWIASTALALFYAIIMVASTGQLPITFVSMAVIAIPLLVIQRSLAFLRLQRNEVRPHESCSSSISP